MLPSLTRLTRNWWLAALRGSLAVILGAAAFVWPGITLEVLVLLFGAYALADGVLMFGFGLVAAEQHEQWWTVVLGGIVGIALGVLAFAQPGAVALALVYVVGAWAIVTGLLEIVAAIRLRQVISTEWLMALSGALSVLFGIVFLYQPGSGALALVYLFGFYAVLAGIAQITLGFRLRGLAGSVQGRTQTAISPSR